MFADLLPGTMKINVAYPATGCQKLFEINDEHKVEEGGCL